MKKLEIKEIVVAVVVMVVLGACNTKTTQEETNATNAQNPTEQTTGDTSVDGGDSTTEGSATTGGTTSGTTTSNNSGTTTSNDGFSNGTGNTTNSSNDSTTGNGNDDATNGTIAGTSDDDTSTSVDNNSTNDSNDSTAGNNDNNSTTVTDDSNTSTDSTPPLITLNGEYSITLVQNAVYTEFGASAQDDVDGKVDVSISGNVDTSTVGSCSVMYTARDSAGNSTTKTRTINVINKENHIQSITFTASPTHFIRTKLVGEYYPVVSEAKVVAQYEDGHSEEITDKIHWRGTKGKMRAGDGRGKIIFYDENNVTLRASYQNIESNAVHFVVENAEHTGDYLYAKIYNEIAEKFPKRGAGIEIHLLKQPKADVVLPVRVMTKDHVFIEQSGTDTYSLHFKAGEGWDRPQAVTIVDKDDNNTQPYTLYTDAFESNDSNYDSVNPKDIEIKPHTSIELIAPPLRKRKGAIRGVRVQMLVYAKTGSLKAFKLINPPKGMKLAPPPLHTINEFNDMSRSATKIIWDVPMDAVEGKIYNITAEATNTEGKKGSITFPIKVPKTKPIQTTLINNELIVTDPDSPLNSMKMKVHEGSEGDISNVRLRSVEYGDVWEYDTEALDVSKPVTFTVLVIDNMPNRLDIKFPSYMDTFEKRNSIGAYFDKYLNDGLSFLSSQAWGWLPEINQIYNYENTNGINIPKNFNGEIDGTSKIFIFPMNQKRL
jgi:hypothetical protein